MRTASALGAAFAAVLALSGCPVQPTYSSTITPIYAATGLGGTNPQTLFVYNGSSWSSTSVGSPVNSIVVSGSGSGAVVLAGTNAGVSEFNGTSWTALNSGLGAAPVKGLVIGSNLYAATATGVSVLNADGQTWTNNGAVFPVNAVASAGTFTFVATNTGLRFFNGGAQTASYLAGVVQAVFVDPYLDVFAGTTTALSVWTTQTSSFSGNLLPTGASVKQITMDIGGNLYAATTGGLYILSRSTVLASSTPANCVCVDGTGTIYVGTASGLMVSKDGGSTWTTELSGENVTSVVTTAPLYSF
jgi:ligand-binding sensor domain-containing protein